MSHQAKAFLYSASAILFASGLTYASVPLYKLFCNATGFGGAPRISAKIPDASESPILRKVRVVFESDVSRKFPWTFSPEIKGLVVRPGETALAFYRARNNSESPLTGMATYNIIPSKAAPYFNKIQCFCFEKQRLDPHEEVDMPVFFYIDKEFALDGNMNDVNEIVLAYTFFKHKE